MAQLQEELAGVQEEDPGTVRSEEEWCEFLRVANLPEEEITRTAKLFVKQAINEQSFDWLPGGLLQLPADTYVQNTNFTTTHFGRNFLFQVPILVVKLLSIYPFWQFFQTNFADFCSH